MRYFGSKGSTVEKLHDLISARIPTGTFCDPFGGIATVGSYFKARGYGVWTGDILTAPHYFQVARVKLDRTPSFGRLKTVLKLQRGEQIVEVLNSQEPRDGWLTKEYAKKRMFFSKENAGRIESCRAKINEWSSEEWLTGNERAFLLASLVNSVDRVANTAGTYYANLKFWHRKSLKPFQFELLRPTRGTQDCHCFLGQARELVGTRKFDILYLDPPYNERCYASYYHLPETLAKGETPRVRGQSGIPASQRVCSDFNRPRLATRALESLLADARFKLLAFHYSDHGLVARNSIRALLSHLGHVEEFKLYSRGYTTSRMSRTVEQRLYLVQNG